jgi:hypothetical protein
LKGRLWAAFSFPPPTQSRLRDQSRLAALANRWHAMRIAKLNSKGAAAMSGPHLDINEIIGFQIESTAEWRRLKAKDFPDDMRNLRAAEELDRLAGEISDLEGSELHRRIDELSSLSNEVDGYSFCEDLNESVSEELRSIGFHGGYETGVAFLEWYRDNLETVLRKHINSDDSTIAAPDLNHQIESDPTVKAAKQQYDQARAKAYAEARKRL